LALVAIVADLAVTSTPIRIAGRDFFVFAIQDRTPHETS
jgi:hypothetical protein